MGIYFRTYLFLLEDFMAEQTVSRLGELSEAIYKNVRMGSDLTLALMPKVKNDQLKSEMSEQLGEYEQYAAKAKKLIHEKGEEAKEESPISKWMAKMGITMNTMTDSTSSHIAEMMIQGSTMNITDLLRKIHESEDECGGREELDLARDIVSFEERNIEKMKAYL